MSMILTACLRLPWPKDPSNTRVMTLATCLDITLEEIRAYHFGSKDPTPEHLEMMLKLAHREYGRVFAAIRLTALGVANQYDWGDK